jgi:cytochrome oxidase Cu insertion factor (SCO1/SenC/PrrC family)
MRHLHPAVIPFLLVVTIVAAGVLWRLGDLGSQSGTQTLASPPVKIGAFSLSDQNGMRRTQADYRGKYMLVFFGYT